MAVTPSQLAMQTRMLDTHLRWDSLKQPEKEAKESKKTKSSKDQKDQVASENNKEKESLPEASAEPKLAEAIVGRRPVPPPG
eukprot:2641201-Pyramimonas_sp.AAC.1